MILLDALCSNLRIASGLNFGPCQVLGIEQSLLQDRLDWSKGLRGSSVFLGRVRIPPITGLKDRLTQQFCFLVESEFYRLRFCCNPSSVRERPRQQLCFSLRETVSTLKRSPVLNLLMWPGAGVDRSQLMRLIKMVLQSSAVLVSSTHSSMLSRLQKNCPKKSQNVNHCFALVKLN